MLLQARSRLINLRHGAGQACVWDSLARGWHPLARVWQLGPKRGPPMLAWRWLKPSHVGAAGRAARGGRAHRHVLGGWLRQGQPVNVDLVKGKTSTCHMSRCQPVTCFTPIQWPPHPRTDAHGARRRPIGRVPHAARVHGEHLLQQSSHARRACAVRGAV